MTRATTRNHGTVRFLVFLVIALVAMMPTGVFAQSIPGLVAAWGFNEGVGTTTADASGNNNTGTISGATWSTQGRFGGALTFDGTNDVGTALDAARITDQMRRATPELEQSIRQAPGRSTPPR